MSKLSYYLEMGSRLRPLKAAPKFLNYLKYKALERRAVTSVKRYAPQIASVLVSIRCNLNCGYCTEAKVLRENKDSWRDKETDLATIKRIFANPLFSDCLLVDLLGGEPLLVKDLEEIVAYLAGRGHIINTSTNGLLLAERIAGLKKAGISRINVSVYKENRALLERDLGKINGVFPVHTSFVLLRSMIEKEPEKIIETARFVREAGSLSLRFWMYRPMGINPQPGEITTESNPAYLELKRKMEAVMPGFCLWPEPVRTGKVHKLCPQLWQRVNCRDALGTMGICCGTEKPLTGPGSGLFDANPDTVFNHPTLVEMRKMLLDPESEPPEVCRSCNLLGDPGW